uniref:Uncharacterized protein LOC101330542 n=1 Tax=Tursiops truncatus TaxID=9739 RepID=A0A6J3SA86_TURTR|nr:uncharacterized protein LOC101330542 [Tursiops truncatus]XP_033723779.1 uncharacterized protein LOC101330542 [Tursiops truncatus]XP_033723780.1 uncharacterized protein LOC101330542 [Tursiops truncatus]XP_033723782.1 uncharacterized protein LOC101330542 [Tursiops truncatus]
MPRRAHSHRLLSASRLLPVYYRRPLPPRDTHLRSNTQTHSGDSWGPEKPARSGDPPLPAPTLPLPPPAGRVLEWRGLCCCPGVGWGCPGDRMGRRCTRRAGLRDGGCGRESPCPASFQASRGEEGTAKRPGSLPEDQAPWQPGSACVAASPALSHFSDTGAHNLLALFLSFPPASSHGGRGATRCALPPRPTVPTDPLVRSAPALQRGSEPSRRGHSRWAARAKTGRGRSVFRAPISFHGLLGRVVLPLAVRLREETRLGDQKTTNPCILRDEGGRGVVLSVLVLFGWRWKPTKGRAGVLLRLFGAGRFTRYARSLSNLHDNPARHYCIQPTTCQRSQTARVVEMGLNPEP